MKIVLIGGEKIAYHLARRFLSKGHNVMMVNKNDRFCDEMAKKLRAVVVRGDGSKRYILEQLELDRSDLFVALTPNDQDNLVACLTASRVYGIERPVAMVNDPDNKAVFEKMGIKSVVSPTEILGVALEDSLFRENITNLLPSSEKVSILRIEMTDKSPIIGEAIKDIPLPDESVIGAIVRDDEVVIPRGNTIIERGDVLLVLSSPTVQSSVFETLLGEV
jgi:trk system potassium uptake protein TrkA